MSSTPDFSTLHPGSIAAADHREQTSLPSTRDLFGAATEASGISIRQMLKECRQGSKWPGKMTQHEYVSWRLYEKSRDERKLFISDWVHWPIHDICMDEVWSPRTEDKWQCTQELLSAGIPTIPCVAIVDRSGASFDGTDVLRSEADIQSYVESADGPLFAKPNTLMGSFGAFRIDGVDGDKLVLNGGQDRLPLLNIVEHGLSDLTYVLQPVVCNHSDIAEYAEGLATVRNVNFVRNGTVRLDRCVLKIPVQGNYADNNWRSGNLLADIDPATGRIEQVSRGVGPHREDFTHHPDTGTALVGVTLPHWDRVVEVNRDTAALFGAINYQSQDIALTPDGPVVVEVNSGGSFALPQMAAGRGLLNAQNKEFFEACGVNFRSLPKPPYD